MFELFLSKTPNKEASPAVARKPRHPAKKFSSHFLICARRFFFSAEFEAVFCKAKCATKRDVALDPPNPFAGNAKELPKDSFTKLFKLVIIIVSRKKPLYYILYTIMLYN